MKFLHTRSASLADLCRCALVAVAAIAAASGLPAIAATPAAGVLSAAFYTDTSCFVSIDGKSSVGRTLLDADFGDAASRTLIHCDTDDGRRLTLLARSDEIGTRGRFEFLDRAEIDSGVVGFIAWLTRAGTAFVDETAPRRYVASGSVIIREMPAAEVAGAARHSSRLAFARIAGVLEPLIGYPDEQESPVK